MKRKNRPAWGVDICYHRTSYILHNQTIFSVPERSLLFEKESFAQKTSRHPSRIVRRSLHFLFRLLLCRRSDRKSTRPNSSHVATSYAVFCWQKDTQRGD